MASDRPLSRALPRLSLIAAVALGGLCLRCVSALTSLTADAIATELGEISTSRRRRRRPGIVPRYLWCQRCETRGLVYRLR